MMKLRQRVRYKSLDNDVIGVKHSRSVRQALRHLRVLVLSSSVEVTAKS